MVAAGAESAVQPGDRGGIFRGKLAVMADAGGEPAGGGGLGWRWDVALSFAGAQREFAERVSAELGARGVRCFYDFDEQVEVELWGKHLAEHLPSVYGDQAAIVVVFVFAQYAQRGVDPAGAAGGVRPRDAGEPGVCAAGAVRRDAVARAVAGCGVHRPADPAVGPPIRSRT